MARSDEAPISAGAATNRRTSRRLVIEQAAVECLSKNPYSTTTVQAIADAAGISVGLMYRDVASKEEILLLIFDHVLTRYEREFSEAAGFKGSPIEKLHLAMERYFNIVASELDRTLITYRESAQLSEAAREEVKCREHLSNRPFEEILEEGIADGSMRPVHVGVTAYCIASLAHAWALKGWYLRDVISLDGYISANFSMMADHLTCERRRGEAARIGIDG